MARTTVRLDIENSLSTCLADPFVGPHHPAHIPSPSHAVGWNGTFGGNISLVESEVSIGENELTLRKALDPNVSDKRPLQGQSPYLINLDFSYDNYNSGTTIGLYFNVFINFD